MAEWQQGRSMPYGQEFEDQGVTFNFLREAVHRDSDAAKQSKKDPSKIHALFKMSRFSTRGA